MGAKRPKYRRLRSRQRLFTAVFNHITAMAGAKSTKMLLRMPVNVAIVGGRGIDRQLCASNSVKTIVAKEPAAASPKRHSGLMRGMTILCATTGSPTGDVDRNVERRREHSSLMCASPKQHAQLIKHRAIGRLATAPYAKCLMPLGEGK